jgi:hypothetical protein
MKLLIFLLIIKVSTAIHIGCNFNELSWKNQTYYSCYVNSVQFSDDLNHVTGYSGTHSGGKSAENVGGVFFAFEFCPRFGITKFPRGLSSIFSNIAVLLFDSCAIENLNGDELQEFPMLKILRIWPGNLVTIPGNLFTFNPNMIHIDFDANKIQHVGEGLLDNLKNLTHVDFNRNVCIQRIAENQSSIPGLIEALRLQCPDNKPKTSTTESTSTTPTTVTTTSTTNTKTTTTTTPENSSTRSTQSPSRPDRCFTDFIENFICELNDKVFDLILRIGTLEHHVIHLVGLDSQFLEFKRKIESLERRIESLESS